MAIVTSIIGKSGSGKTRSISSIKNIDEMMIIRPSKKPFPFKNKFKQWDKGSAKGQFFYTNQTDAAIAVMKKMDEVGKKIIIVEDSTFFMTDYFMETALERGFDKFNQLALNYYNLLKAAEDLSEDVRVYFINHIDEDINGYMKVKTIGKLLDEKIDIPSLLTIVLQSTIFENKHKFQTNKKSNMDIAKSPEEMFEDLYIDNDLQSVDNAIIEYYGIENK